MGELSWTIESADGIYQLQHDPQGWETLVLKFVRDEFYHGVFYEFTGSGGDVVPVGFYCKGGGKEFIDQLYDKYGQEAIANMRIDYKCQDGSFEEIYFGKLNFSSYEERFFNNKLYSWLNIEQFGITQKVRNREEVPVNVCSNVSLDGLPLTSYSPCYNLNLHSKEITYRSSLVGPKVDTLGYAPPSSASVVLAIVPGLPVDLNDLKETSTPGADITVGLSTNIEPFYDSTGQLIVPPQITIDIKLAGTYSDTWEMGGSCDRGITGGGYKVFIWKGNAEFPTSTLVYTSTAFILTSYSIDETQVNNQTFNFNETAVINGVVAGDKLWIIISGGYNVDCNMGVTFIFSYNNTSFINLSALTTYPPSVAKASLIHEAWSRLSEIITDQTFAFKSEYYGRKNSMPINYPSNGCNSFAAITSGKNIRAFPDEPITTSLKNMFRDSNGVDNVGLGIETINGTDVIRVEKKKHFYDDTVIFQKDYVPGIKITFSEKYVYNELESGYLKWEIEQINGLDEPNTNRKFSLPDIRTIKKNLNFLSGFITGMYAIELTRRTDYANFPTEDYKYDYDIFLIALNRGVDGNGNPNVLQTAEKAENFSSVTDLFSPATSYNLRYSPTMNLLRWFPVYSIGMNKVLNYQNYWIIILTDYEGNVEMTTKLNLHASPKCPGEFGYDQSGFFIPLTLVEKPQYQSPVGSGVVNGYPVPLAPFTVEQLYGEPLFMPEEITFTHPVSYSEFKTIKSNPKGLVKISHDGLNYKTGYIKTFEFDLRKKMGTFVLYRKS